MSIDLNQVAGAAHLAEKVAPKLQELKKATQSFEAVFLKKLFATMREGVKHVKIGDSQGEEIYNDMFDQALAESATKSGSYGIGDMLYKSFAPKVAAMEELRLRAEEAAKTNSVPKQGSDRPITPGPEKDVPLQRLPNSNPIR
jgi:Rod binding domain-containing protein